MSKLSTKCAALVALLLILQHFATASRNENSNDDTNTSETQAAQTITPAQVHSPNPPVSLTIPPPILQSPPRYCDPSLCELYNGTHVVQAPHVACHNNGSFGPTCGAKPHLLYMSDRRRKFILGLHNLARSRIAAGKIGGYKPASHMPLLKWDTELEYLASLHVKRCQFAHDECRNTQRYQYSGQNIGYFWIGREFRSHSKRMKAFIVNWFREYLLANQTFIDSYYPHPEGKKIGHFTMLVADRAHRVGCAAVRFRDPNQIGDMKFLMTCNYDFNNLVGEPVYQTGATASKCVYKISETHPALCDWKDAVYDYDSDESLEAANLLDNNITI